MRSAGLAAALLSVMAAASVAAVPGHGPGVLRIVFDAPAGPLDVGETWLVTYRVADAEGRPAAATVWWVAGPTRVAEISDEGPGYFALKTLSEGRFTIYLVATADGSRAEGLIEVHVSGPDAPDSGAARGVQPDAAVLLAATVSLLAMALVIGLRAHRRTGGPPCPATERRARRDDAKRRHVACFSRRTTGVDEVGSRGPSRGRSFISTHPHGRPPASKRQPTPTPVPMDPGRGHAASGDRPGGLTVSPLGSRASSGDIPPAPGPPRRSLELSGPRPSLLGRLLGRGSDPTGATIIVHGDYVPAKVDSRIEIRDSVVTRASFHGSFPGPAGSPDLVVRKLARSEAPSPASEGECSLCGQRLRSFGHTLALPGGFRAEGLCDECQLLLALMMGRRSRRSAD